MSNTWEWVRFFCLGFKKVVRKDCKIRCFHVTISESFKHFQNLTLKQIFWKTKTFFKNLDYHFLVEVTKIESTPFLFKTALSEAIVQTNKMVNTKWTYHKEWGFASYYLFFWENLFQFYKFLKRVNLMYERSKCQYSYFS